MTHKGLEDYELNSEWDIFIGHRGDLSFVSGRDAFEQEISIRLQENVVDLIGRFETTTVLNKAKLYVKRVAREMDEIDRIADIDARKSEDDDSRIVVEVIYDTGEKLIFEE